MALKLCAEITQKQITELHSY